MATSSPKLPDRSSSDVSNKMSVIGVFWDIENCAVPHGKSALALVQKIREKLFSGKQEVEFMCVCDTSKENRDVIQELNYAQVTVVHVHATSKNAADDKLRQSLHRFANAYPPHSTAVLLSGDVNFTSELSDLRYRHRHYVILVHPSSAQDALLNCAHECHSYEELIRDLPYRSQKRIVEGSTELLVDGLPRSRPNKALQHRLEMLSDNCGGKVIKVFGSQAILKFPNPEAATRAKKRLQEEDVYGAKINVDIAEKTVSQFLKRQDGNLGFCSSKMKPKNCSITNLQRSHSLSPEPHRLDSNISNCKAVGRNSSSSPYPERRGSFEFRRQSPYRTVVYYGKGSKPVESSPGNGIFDSQIQQIPEKDEQVQHTKPTAVQSVYVDASTMTEMVTLHENSTNRSKKRYPEKGTQFRVKAGHAAAKNKTKTPSKTENRTASLTRQSAPLEIKTITTGDKCASSKESFSMKSEKKATKSKAENSVAGLQMSGSDKKITASSHQKRRKKKAQNSHNKLTPDDKSTSQRESVSPKVVTCVYTSKKYSEEENQLIAVKESCENFDEQTSSDVIIEEGSNDEGAANETEATAASGIQLGVKPGENVKSITGSVTPVRPHSARANLDAYRSKSDAFEKQASVTQRRSRKYKRTWINQESASPHKLTKPHPVRPKLSPVKYPGPFDNTYFSNTYQYCATPGGKFSYYYRRNSYHSSAGYYSHFGSPTHSEIESSEIQDFMDSFNHKRKVNREVLFLQQQVYQKDEWPKSEDEEYELQEDLESYCRDECHSAPPLPYHRGYHSLTPEKSPYSSRSPHFRRTPGAHRPLSQPRHFGGERPGSSMSNRSGSSSDSYSSYSYPEPSAQFRPIQFGLSRLPQAGYGDLAMDGEPEDQVVELMVSNLDYNISAREWRKILYAEFHQHVEVIDVHILTQPDNTNIGYIKVPTLEEAKYAISQFHRKKIGYKRIHVTIVNQDDDSVANAKTNVVTILQEVPSHQLSLYKLMELFEKRFHHPITASEIYSFQDVLCIVEVEGQGRIVRLLSTDKSSVNQNAEITPDAPDELFCSNHCTDGSTTYHNLLETMPIPFVMLQLRSFSAQLHTMLQSHAGTLPLITFPVCYQAEFGSLNVVSHGGVALEHLISSVPGVYIQTTNTGSKHVQWAENRATPPLEPGNFCSNSLLNQQLAQFSREVVVLLKNVPQCRIAVNKFIPTYHHLFGRQCRVADYGYTKLTELLDAMPHIVQVIGHGNHKYVTLTHRAQVKRFAMDLLRVLKSQASKQVTISEFPIVYNKVFSRQFDITDYGMCYLEDVLQELPENTIAISGTGDNLLFSLPRRDQTFEEIERTKQFALEVIDLLKHSPQCRIPFNRFIPAYHHHFGKQCRVSDYGFTKLVELFEAIPHVLQVIDEQDDRVLTLVESELLKVLEEQVVALLKSCPDHKLPVPEFLASFTKFHGNSLRLQDYGVTSVVQLIEKINRIAEIESQDGKYIIKLIDDTHIQMLAHHVLLLLMEQLDGSMSLNTLQERYRHLFGYSITEMELEHDLKDLVQLSTIGTKKMVKLCPLQMFARDVRTVLRHHHGKLPLAQFEFSYANQFGVQLVPATYGYSSTMNLLQAIPHVVQLKGKGYNVILILCQDFQGKLFTGAPTHVEQATSPIPIDDITGELSLQQPSPEQTSQEGEGELMLISSARSTPCDLLAARVPSGVPSPEIQPAPTVLTTKDLIRFDSSGSTDISDIFSGLSPEEKCGQKTPLCKTPVSDMLQFAAQLLPPSPCTLLTPPGPSYNYTYHPPSEYNCLYSGQCLYNVPPVPRDAPHVSTLEQREDNPTECTLDDDGQSCDAGSKHLTPGLIMDPGGNFSIEADSSTKDDARSELSCVEQENFGETLFWHKTSSNQIDHVTEHDKLPSPNAISSPVGYQCTGDSSSLKMPSDEKQSSCNDQNPETLLTEKVTPVKQNEHKLALSESFSSHSGSPTSSMTEKLSKIEISSSCSPNISATSRENDEQPAGRDAQPLMDSGIASPGSLPKNHGSGAEEDLDASIASTPSPSKKLGTPRRCRLAAKFLTSSNV